MIVGYVTSVLDKSKQIILVLFHHLRIFVDGVVSKKHLEWIKDPKSPQNEKSPNPLKFPQNSKSAHPRKIPKKTSKTPSPFKIKKSPNPFKIPQHSKSHNPLKIQNLAIPSKCLKIPRSCTTVILPLWIYLLLGY